eukprot:scaffold110199_cov36-Phaeocystis_antarctica.AAC.1
MPGWRLGKLAHAWLGVRIPGACLVSEVGAGARVGARVRAGPRLIRVGVRVGVRVGGQGRARVGGQGRMPSTPVMGTTTRVLSTSGTGKGLGLGHWALGRFEVRRVTVRVDRAAVAVQPHTHQHQVEAGQLVGLRVGAVGPCHCPAQGEARGRVSGRAAWDPACWSGVAELPGSLPATTGFEACAAYGAASRSASSYRSASRSASILLGVMTR